MYASILCKLERETLSAMIAEAGVYTLDPYYSCNITTYTSKMLY